MTYDREPRPSSTCAVNDVIVSHSAELVRGE